MKGFEISNLVTKILFSSGRTRKLINGGVSEIFSENNKRARPFIRDLKVLKQACENQHTRVWKDDFKIFSGNCKSSIKKKIGEALYIRTLKSTLSAKEKLIRLEYLRLVYLI